MNTVYDRMKERYALGEVPWDDSLPPPEVEQILGTLPPGRALDLGCGYGRASIYLAGKGWQVDGVDFVEDAIKVARARAVEAGVAGVAFHVAPVTDLHFLAGPYDFALDVGCAHSLEEGGLAAYWRELKRLLKPGAVFLWFVRMRPDGAIEDESGPQGIAREVVQQMYSDGFRIEREEFGRTEMRDGSAWTSAWFWLRRL